MSFQYKKESRLAVFTINRPEVNNALNLEAAQELHKTMLDISQIEPHISVRFPGKSLCTQDMVLSEVLELKCPL